jgi:hypothetical protein
MAQPTHWPEETPLEAADAAIISHFSQPAVDRDLSLIKDGQARRTAGKPARSSRHLGLASGQVPEPGPATAGPESRIGSSSAVATPTSAAVRTWKQAGVKCGDMHCMDQLQQGRRRDRRWFRQQADAWRTSLGREQPAAPEPTFEVLGPRLVGNLGKTRGRPLLSRSPCLEIYIAGATTPRANVPSLIFPCTRVSAHCRFCRLPRLGRTASPIPYCQRSHAATYRLASQCRQAHARHGGSKSKLRVLMKHCPGSPGVFGTRSPGLGVRRKQAICCCSSSSHRPSCFQKRLSICIFAPPVLLCAIEPT